MIGARQGKGQYQYTLLDEDLDELNEWLPRVRDKLKQERARRLIARRVVHRRRHTPQGRRRWR